MAAKRHKKHKKKLQGIKIQCVTMNKNRDSEFLRIHQVFAAGFFWNPVPYCKRSEMHCDLKGDFYWIFNNTKIFQEKATSLCLDIMAET